MTPRLFPVAIAAAIAATMTFVAPARADTVKVSINYQMLVEAKDTSTTAMAEAQMSGRRAIYTMMANECVALRETIAKSCTLLNFSVQAGSRYRRRTGESNKSVNISGRGTYRIEMKTADAAE